MIADALILILGLALLTGGGELLVRGSAGLARALGVAPLLIGLTIVAFGTSSPELAVNVVAAGRGNGDICFGNIVGSNLANIGLILGCCALIRPLNVHAAVVVREIPMMLLATVAAALQAMDFLLRPGSGDLIDRMDAAVMLLFFLVFLYYTIGDALRGRKLASAQPEAGPAPDGPTRTLALYAGQIVVGLAVLIGGGRLTVGAATELARALGVSEIMIGLTVVAVGTSLPELAASVAATLRGHADLAVGNIVGSNIFNLLFIQGVSASISPIAVPVGGIADLAALTFFSLLLLPFAVSHRFALVRWEGALLIAAYAGYMCWRTLA